MKKEEKLYGKWIKKGFEVFFPKGDGTKCDYNYVSDFFNRKFFDELQRRGYDIMTFKFSVEPMEYNEKFTAERVRKEEREKALTELTELSQDMGMYD